MAQLAIAWCAHNPHMSSVITGASNAGQLRSNVGALDVLPLLTPEVVARLDAISPPRVSLPASLAAHIRSGASMPSNPKPFSSTCALKEHRPRRETWKLSSGARSTGQCS